MNLDNGEGSGNTAPLVFPGASSSGPNTDEHEGRDGAAPSDGPRRSDIRVDYWTKDITKELIAKYNEDLIDKVNQNATPLLCDAIIQEEPDSVNLLLEHAQRNDRFVVLKTGRCPTLDWAINNRTKIVAKFVLDHIAQKKLTVEESCLILTNYLFPLIKEFPDLMQDYIENDKFSFKYGEIFVPYSLIDKNGKRPIAMTTDECLDGWDRYDTERMREFWVENCEEHSKDLDNSSDFQVKMAAKFLCIDQHAVRVCSYHETMGTEGKPGMYYAWNHVLRRMRFAKLPHDIFKSEALAAFANWMFYSLYNRFALLVIMDVLTAGLFSFFAWFYGMKKCEKEEDDSLDPQRQKNEDPSDLHQLISIIAIIASCVLPTFSLLIRFSRIKIPSIVITLVIVGHVVGVYSLDSGDDKCDHVVGHPRHDDLSAFLTSIECVFVWFLVVEALLAFDRIGPFVSMVKDSFIAAVPFTILGVFVLLGFSFAVGVVYNYTEDKKEENDDENTPDCTCEDKPQDALTKSSSNPVFNRDKHSCEEDNIPSNLEIPHVFKILFHACVGNFEEEMFRSTKGAGWIGTWRSVLFSLFLFIGGIVLISLLVAILSESFDKIKHREKEELVKCRAEIVGAAFFSVARDIVKGKMGIRETCWKELHKLSLLCQLKASHSLHSMVSLKPRHRHKYFHYLVPIDKLREEKNNEWEGRIGELEKVIRKEVRDIRKAVGLPESSSSTSDRLIDQRIQDRVDDLSNRMLEIRDILQKILQNPRQEHSK